MCDCLAVVELSSPGKHSQSYLLIIHQRSHCQAPAACLGKDDEGLHQWSLKVFSSNTQAEIKIQTHSHLCLVFFVLLFCFLDV